MLKENEILKPFKEEKRKELDFWTSFYENIYFHNSYHRFSLKEVSLTKERLQSNQSNVSSKSENASTSIFQRFRKMPSVESQIQGNVEFSKDYRPEYLEMIESDKDTLEKEEGRNMMVLKSLTKFLHLCLPPEVPKMKIQKIALEYITCQKKQSSYLLQLFWYSLNYSEDCHPYDKKIKIRGTMRDRALFMLFERYYMAVNEINFPVSKGFHTFFVFIGFRCLHQSFFMQYVRNKVFILETEFMDRLIHDVGDDESYFQLISRLISQFDQSKAQHFMLMWRGFGVSSVLCQRYLSNLLSNGSSLESIPRDFLAESEKFPVSPPSGSSSSRDPSLIQKQAESIYFRPLISVMTSIKLADAKQKKQNIWKKKVVESDAETNSKLSFISDNALEHTIRAIDDASALEAF
ncbi:uncharacterized protein LOC124447347 isoform X2 [Xenia sp. Carnegie-2017]|uniref:uncharacterized protein LOC124447347 isoform X2 n=1 Tax=Xenia sp. Carnegie-2017 TaxID=2897299 RepID=UPI001F03B886|nr:uncharacterized protein LOC124447347 isoform X2 [Xenia sp. Carnegie-2017]